jgi:hypothetical protein
VFQRVYEHLLAFSNNTTRSDVFSTAPIHFRVLLLVSNLSYSFSTAINHFQVSQRVSTYIYLLSTVPEPFHVPQCFQPPSSVITRYRSLSTTLGPPSCSDSFLPSSGHSRTSARIFEPLDSFSLHIQTLPTVPNPTTRFSAVFTVNTCPQPFSTRVQSPLPTSI